MLFCNSGVQMSEEKMRPLGRESRAGKGGGTSDQFTRVGGLSARQKLLLHSCCGPCSTACIERLAENYDITVFYYNPCITDAEEYEKRKAAQIAFIEAYNRDHRCSCEVSFIEGDYEPEEYYARVKGLETEPEGGRRCAVCFAQRLGKTAETARKLGFRLFTTTLTVSPHKDYVLISGIAKEKAAGAGVEFLDIDFRKKAGFQRSVQLSREYGLYRQSYCGCEYSKR